MNYYVQDQTWKFETEMYQNLETVPSVDAVMDIEINKSRVVPGKTDEKTLLSLCGYVQMPEKVSLSSQPDPGPSSNVSRHAE